MKERQAAKDNTPLAGKLLHIGCGSKAKANLPSAFQQYDEVRLDINPDVSPDIVADMRDLSIVSDESYDVLYSSHNIEHLFTHEVVATLREWRRILKTGGFAVIRCPDLGAVFKAVAKTGLTGTLYESPIGPITPLDIIYGHIASVRRGNIYMAHKTGFTHDNLLNVMKLAGFSRGRVEEQTRGYELIATFYK